MRYLRACLPALLAVGLVSLPAFPSESAVQSSNLPPDTRKQIRQTLLAMPLAFEPATAGPGASKFVMRRTGVSASFTEKGFEIILPGEGKQTARTGITFHGGATRPTGMKELGSRSNYFLGSDRARWRTGVANFAQLRYAELWPGIDLVFYGNGEHLEHDFVVAPGADASRIRLDFGGQERVFVDHNGDLVVQTASGQITFRKPAAYQETAGGRQLVQAGFQVKGSSAGFVLGKYDHRRALTIDPVLVFSTLLAGSVREDLFGLALDSAGNIYVSGSTLSADFPTASPEQAACAGCKTGDGDAFIAKLNPTGTALVYSTFLGGQGSDVAFSIAVDASGNAIVGGTTTSTDFPSVNAIATPACCDIEHMFVTSLSSTGASLNYSGVIGPLKKCGHEFFEAIHAGAPGSRSGRQCLRRFADRIFHFPDNGRHALRGPS
jgi:hypothetical protein